MLRWDKLMELARFNLPLLITENGFCSENDEDRWRYIHSHISQAALALRQGVEIIGYLYWSLIIWQNDKSLRFQL